MPRKSHLIAGLAGVTLVAVPIVLANTASAGEPEPSLRLTSATSTVTVNRYSDEGVYLDLGTHVIAGSSPFEITAARKSYKDPVVATQVIRKNGVTTTKKVPSDLVTTLGGLSKFLHVTLTDASGKKVVDKDQDFCPNGQANRTRPDAPPTSPYPPVCGRMPFSIASVWGLQAGWGVSATQFDYNSPPLDIPAGTYTATVGIKKPHRDAFGIPADKARVTLKVIVKDVEVPDRPGGALAAHAHGAPGKVGAPDTRPKGVRRTPAKSRPVGAAAAPPAGPRPDLRSLPAWDIQVGPAPDGGPEPGTEPDGREYLSFSANVWNAGTSPLVVDGFRRPGGDLMDAYQYFYDAKGNQTGWTPSGTMEWDPREGHTHWHFTDFATYRLLDASKNIAVRSGKEAFCLLPTDPVDLRLKSATWKPMSTDLSTACGGETAIAVRQALDIGWGDTYSQNLPGQSFDVTGLPNGTYYIEVKANPEKRLVESDLKNNTSLRKVILGGTPGARTVTVPPYQLVNAP
jgi:hypothetical protein